MTCLRIGNETLKKYCERNNLCYCTMWDRIERGMTPEQAVSTPLKPKCNLKYVINGKSARSQMDKNTYQRYVKSLKK